MKSHVKNNKQAYINILNPEALQCSASGLKFNPNPVIIFEKVGNHDFELPSKATKDSAGIDFRACLTAISGQNELSQISILPNQIVMVPLGFKMEMRLHTPFVMMLFIRSSIGKKGLVLANGTGIIDQDYRGELIACLRNICDNILTISHGDRIVQGIVMPIYHFDISADSVNSTDRGSGGFGSTGK